MVKRSLARLEDMNIIKRNTTFIEGNGKGNRRRLLSINNRKEWKAHNAPTKMEGAKINDGRCKNDEWKAHNAPIKDNIKKAKDTQMILELFSFEGDLYKDIDCGLATPEEDVPEKFYLFAFDEIERLGKNITFVVSYDKIQSYKDGKCMGSCYEAS